MPLTSGDSIADAANAALDRLAPHGALGLAVSGGGDSMALLRLAAAWAAANGVRVAVATVDHGLRPEAADEAAFVAGQAGALDLPHATLRWRGWDGAGNLQQAAREARTALLSGWAAGQDLAAVALGHTLDDQAETVLLRMARGSGVDGLSAMAESSARGGALWLRPLLGMRRAALRAWLTERGEPWRDDPSNADLRYDRIKARAALEALAPLGLTAETLAATAGRMRRARGALDAATATLAEQAVRRGVCGEATLARAALADAPEDIALRLLATALCAVSGDGRRPRSAGLEAALTMALRGAPGAARTLHGCLLRTRTDTVVVAREPAAAEQARATHRQGAHRQGAHRQGADGDGAQKPGALWDARWRLTIAADGAPGALGSAGLAVLRAARRAGCWAPSPAWRAAPRAARAATPALWRNGALVAAPLAAYGEGMTAVLADDWPQHPR